MDKNNDQDSHTDGLFWFNPEALTVANILKDAGYETALVGKADPLLDPFLSGFDTFFGQLNKSACHNKYPREVNDGPAGMRYNLSLNWKDRSRLILT